MLDCDIAQNPIDDQAIERLLTLAGASLTVAAGLLAAIGSIDRFYPFQKLDSEAGRSHARAMPVEAAWAAAKAPPLRAFFIRIRAALRHSLEDRLFPCNGRFLAPALVTLTGSSEPAGAAAYSRSQAAVRCPQ